MFKESEKISEGVRELPAHEIGNFMLTSEVEDEIQKIEERAMSSRQTNAESPTKKIKQEILASS